jgi:hypothetical protein
MARSCDSGIAGRFNSDDRLCSPYRSISWWGLVAIFAILLVNELEFERLHVPFLLAVLSAGLIALLLCTRLRLYIHAISEQASASQMEGLRRVSAGAMSLTGLLLCLCLFLNTISRMR